MYLVCKKVRCWVYKKARKRWCADVRFTSRAENYSAEGHASRESISSTLLETRKRASTSTALRWNFPRRNEEAVTEEAGDEDLIDARWFELVGGGGDVRAIWIRLVFGSDVLIIDGV